MRSNPTGGTVSSGTASISGGAGTLTVSQSSRAAIINWQSFSVGNGEVTNFMMPGVQSAVLNRVLGGSSSAINGTLSANGQLFLINQNGIVIGPGGIVNAAGGFTGSTRDISDSDFLSGDRHFLGHSRAAVLNLGQVNSDLGDVNLIGKRVSNYGTLTANKGTVALAAGDDVVLGQRATDGSTVTVNPSKLSKAAGQGTKIGVNNEGSISAASAQLKAANGNIYALAINNGGVIRASTVHHDGGHVWLTSSKGSVVNTGSVIASATVPGAKGGNVVIKSLNGSVNDVGAVIARGGNGGKGGNVDLSAEKLAFTGTVDLRANGGKSGDLLIDPSTLDVVSGGTGTITSGMNDSSSTIDADTVDTALVNESVTLTATNGITIDQALNWSSGNELTLNTASGSATTLVINQPITATNGGTLDINLSSSTDLITTGPGGSISVGAFLLQSGTWNQVMSTLPGFSVTSDFEIQNSSTFLRAAGGDGMTNPYQIVDVYGLQGIGSPSSNLVGYNYVLSNDIDASGTASWNGGLGFSPIATDSGGDLFNFTGSFDGGGHVIKNLTINAAYYDDGLFVDIGSGGIVKNLGLVGESINTGSSTAGGLAGQNDGTIQNCYSASENLNVYYRSGGLVGYNSSSGTISNSFVTGTVVGSGGSVGGLAGESDGTIQNCYSTATVSGTFDLGGLVGFTDGGNISNSYATGSVSGNQQYIGGLVGESYETTISNSYATGAVSGTSSALDVGGFNGSNDDSASVIQNSYSTGAVDGGFSVGGFAGYNGGTISNSYATGSVTGDLGGMMMEDVMIKGRARRERRRERSSFAMGSSSVEIGGLVGYNDSNSTILNSYATGAVVGSTDVGGLVEFSQNATITSSYSTGSVTGISNAQNVGGFIGNDNSDTIQISYTTGAVNGGSGSTDVGGFVGDTSSSTISDCYYATDGTGQSVGFGATDPTVFLYNGVAANDITGLTLAQLKLPSSYDSAWNFGLGGTWGANGYTNTGLINNGAPYLQSIYPTVALITPMNQTTTYNQTPTGTGFSQTAFTTTLAPSYTDIGPYLTSRILVGATGTNINVGTNPIGIVSITPKAGYAVEVAQAQATETITAKPITVSAVSGLVSTYGNMPAFATDGGGAQIVSGDTLGGTTSYSTSDGFSPGGYLNAGSYSYIPSITGYNSNYVITGYNPAIFTINPATLSYTADSATGLLGMAFPGFTGTVGGFLPNDNLGNATSGSAVFSTSATASSPAGLYDITGSGLSASNYVFVQAASNSTAFALSVPSVIPPPVIPPPVVTMTPPPTVNPTLTIPSETILASFETSSGPVNNTFLIQTGPDSPIGIRFGAEFLIGLRDGDLGYYGLVRPEADSGAGVIATETGKLPLPAFFTLPGNYFSFFQKSPPPLILRELTTLLDTDVHAELAGSESGSAGASGATTTSTTSTTPTFMTLPGEFYTFDQTVLPPRIRRRLDALLELDERAQLAATEEGSSSFNHLPIGGFFVIPGDAFGFGHTEVPPGAKGRLDHLLSREIRDSLSGAR